MSRSMNTQGSRQSTCAHLSLRLFPDPAPSYIPRKPHPNGLLSYGIASYTAVEKMPIVLDLVPHLPGARTNPHAALLELTHRFRKAHPAIPLHVVADSAFGSFTTIEKMRDLGAHATFSMAPNHKPWLWEMLAWECDIDSGRTVLLPILDGREHALASVFHVKSETDKLIDIRTMTTGFSWTRSESAEWTVSKIGQRRTNDDGVFGVRNFLGRRVHHLAASALVYGRRWEIYDCLARKCWC
jgi:hypothetical protein